MKVLLYSHFFYPSVGGLETVSLTLANEFVKNGVQCKVVTTTKSESSVNFSFTIIRNPIWRIQVELVKWADIVLFNGASLALQPWVLILKKPFIWIHTGYQVSCIDGCGWVEGERAPIEPIPSFFFHVKKIGLRSGIVGGSKLLIKRIFAKFLVTKNVAITKWMLDNQPLPKQVQIYNPFPLNDFFGIDVIQPQYDFFFLGRLVSEKGVDTLLRAFSKATIILGKPILLLIIGDGNWKIKMEGLAKELGISSSVTFVGRKVGDELKDYISKGEIAIIPSEWYEPMGGVALELMASGKNLIVSEFGGLKECVGDAGLTFPNGDYNSLADCMVKLVRDVSLRDKQRSIGREIIKDFLPDNFVSQYLALLEKEIVKSQMQS